MSDLFFKLQDQAAPFLYSGDLSACEKLFLEALDDLPESPFHICREQHFSNSPDLVASYFDAIFETEGKKYKIEPGMLRDFEVDVGSHKAPGHKAVPAMLHRFEEVYGNRNFSPTAKLVALAAAHHRLTWIHPFGDGNGRVGSAWRLSDSSC